MAEKTACEQSFKLGSENESEGDHSSNEECFELQKEDELHILMGEKSVDVKIELLSGQAEIYGAEMMLNKKYTLSPLSSISVFTWHGCVINIKGIPEFAYVKKDTDMILKLTLHASLEERRLRAENENKIGPTILIVGPDKKDKSSLCRFLFNYAIRMKRQPMFVDLDIGENAICIPNSVGILSAKNPVDFISGFDNEALQVYHFGYTCILNNIEFYCLLLRKLAFNLRSHMSQADQNIKPSGVIINACDGEILEYGPNSITLVTEHFEIDILCVLENESLYSQVKKTKPSSMEILFFPKVDGDDFETIHKTKREFFWKQSQETSIREYFFGTTSSLKPYQFVVQYSDIQVFKVVPVHSFMRVFSEIKENDVKLMRIELSSELIDQVLGLSSADDVTEDFMYKHVVGFICVIKVDVEKNTITVVSPQPPPLSKKILLLGYTKLNVSQCA
ncbi:unnamed protein product [Larinioides sclopetarius]|uniref:Protein CLP1 homolog n=1 Tax=Larinioides sclopetarius TaxID=280406 RepID=A0AAV1ZH69_9ARAC